MDGTHAVFPDGVIVPPGAVALVDSKAVFGILGIHFLHEPVPRYLCKNGRRRNRCIPCVTLNHRHGLYAKVGNSVAVDQRQLRLDAQLGNGVFHGKEGSV